MTFEKCTESEITMLSRRLGSGSDALNVLREGAPGVRWLWLEKVFFKLSWSSGGGGGGCRSTWSNRAWQ